MKVKQFDVVKLKNNQLAIIKNVKNKNEFVIEVISEDKEKIEHRTITDKEIEKVIYTKKKEWGKDLWI